jgi:hypothetical protein
VTLQHLISWKTQDDQVKKYLVEELDPFLEGKFITERFKGELRVYFEETAVDTRVKAVIIVPEPDEEFADEVRLSFLT